MVGDERMDVPKAIESREVQIGFVYFNGFELTSSLSDMGAMFMIDGQPQVRVAMSFTTAKTLAASLMTAVQAFEGATGTTLLVMDDVRAAYQKAQDAESNR